MAGLTNKPITTIMVETLIDNGGLASILNEAGRQLGNPKLDDLGEMADSYTAIADGLNITGKFFIRSLASVDRERS